MANEMVAYDGHSNRHGVNPIDADDNPYQGQYTAVDRWAFEHYDETIGWNNYTQIRASLVFPEVLIQVDVNFDGWAMPERVRLDDLWSRRSTTQFPRDYRPENYAFFARGEISPDLWLMYQDIQEVGTAEQLPGIPTWLAALATEPVVKEVVFLPNGNFVVGFYNIDDQTSDANLENMDTTHYLYTADGQRVVDSAVTDGNWLSVSWNFSRTIDKLEAQYPKVDVSSSPKTMYLIVRGYMGALDYESREILAVFDWDGTQVYDKTKPDQGILIPDTGGHLTIPERNFNYCRAIAPSLVKQAYDIQKSL
ncbi:MAG: hypothetical protein H7A35_13235 [Planctomycetales bacterium]|nr:MAG: hypothetical protein H7A35_13235 [Planctomycetales bacterium]